MPVDGSMVPTAQSFFPHEATTYQPLPVRAFVERQCVVDGRGYIGAQHAEEVKAHSQSYPRVLPLECHYQEYHSEGYAHDDATRVAPRVP